MPGERHVFDPLLAGVVNQRERQSVFVRPAKLINAGAFAAFRSFTACFLQCDRIAGDCVIAPDMAFRVHNIERPIGLDRPDSMERVGPCAGQRDWTRLGRSRAGTDERDQGTSEKNSQRRLYFHVCRSCLVAKEGQAQTLSINALQI